MASLRLRDIYREGAEYLELPFKFSFFFWMAAYPVNHGFCQGGRCIREYGCVTKRHLV